MRFRNVLSLLVCCSGVALLFLRIAEAQTPARGVAQSAAQNRAWAAASQLHGNLAQVMRGILFPNSNVIFVAQSNNPADVKPAADPSMSTDPLTNTYGGWTAVENSALALAEAANLLMIPGRLCSNGRPVPLRNADWTKFVQGLREAGMTAYRAAQSKDQDKMLDAADAVAAACANCHNRYREKPGGIATVVCELRAIMSERFCQPTRTRQDSSLFASSVMLC